MKRTLLFILLTVCCLFLTACYTDQDPWPETNLGSTSTPEVTTVPPTDPPATSIPQTQPPATQTPLPEDAVDISPNFNG